MAKKGRANPIFRVAELKTYVTLVWVLLLTASLSAQVQPRALSTAEVLSREGPSVVLLEVRNQNGQVIGQASGVIIRADGIVVTNAHVLSGACDITAKLSAEGPSLAIRTVVGLDETTDIAVVRFSTEARTKIRAASLGHSRGLVVGQKVVAIGNPMGLERTVSEGIISGIRESNEGRVIQFTAPISAGSSGGGLFTSSGKLVGITTSSLRESQNINFAVPIENVLTSATLGLHHLNESGAEGNWVMLAPIFCGQPSFELDSGLVIAILGHSLFDQQVQGLLRRLNKDKIPTAHTYAHPAIGEVRDFYFPHIGLRIQFIDGVASSIDLVGPYDHKGFFSSAYAAFSGRLPLGLSWKQPRSSVLQRFGAPWVTQKDENTQWRRFDTYRIGSYRYLLIYNEVHNEGEQLNMVWVSRR